MPFCGARGSLGLRAWPAPSLCGSIPLVVVLRAFPGLHGASASAKRTQRTRVLDPAKADFRAITLLNRTRRTRRPELRTQRSRPKDQGQWTKSKGEGANGQGDAGAKQSHLQSLQEPQVAVISNLTLCPVAPSLYLSISHTLHLSIPPSPCPSVPPSPRPSVPPLPLPPLRVLC